MGKKTEMLQELFAGIQRSLHIPAAASQSFMFAKCLTMLKGKASALPNSAKACPTLCTSCIFLLANEAANHSDGPIEMCWSGT